MDEIKQAVRERYAGAARGAEAGCDETGCCGSGGRRQFSRLAGYDVTQLDAVPSDADLGLGCGNPTAFAGLTPGETVVDLGSGGGIDCFLAAKRVGPEGRVIGVDMTPEMIDLSRRNAAAHGYENVEFRLGEVEALPVADSSADIVISNCVINLVPDKRRAFAEAFRVLKPGGRVAVSDIVTVGEMPDRVRRSIAAYVSCLAGAIDRDEYVRALADAGFSDVRVTAETSYDDPATLQTLLDDMDVPDIDRAEAPSLARRFRSVHVEAVKPSA